MEDFSIKAIVIGVSVFVTILTLSAIVLYFNTARQAAQIVNQRADIASIYDTVINSENFEGELTGVEVRSLINHYAGNANVHIQISLVDGDINILKADVNNDWLNDIGVISESKLNMIEPVSKYMVSKTTNSKYVSYDIFKK